MNNYDLGKELFDNIEISYDTKNELYKNCIRGKRTADLRFRYAGALTALIVTAIVGGTGITAKAFYETVSDRMEKMSDTELEELAEEINSNTSVTIDGAWSRKLTDTETLRMAELERKYYSEAFYPEGEIERVSALSEWDGETVCYVEEDHLLHLPEAEMTDEQLLLFIDYNAKADYVIEKQAEEFLEEDTEEGTYVNPYVEVADVSDMTEQDIIDYAYTHLKQFNGFDLGPEWNARVEAFVPSGGNPEYAEHDSYFIYWEQTGATPSSTDYVVVLGLSDLGLEAVAVRGREHWASLKQYTEEEALGMVDDIRAKALEAIREYGFSGTPSKERYELYDTDDVRQIRFAWIFGDHLVEVEWEISTDRPASIEICPKEWEFDPEEDE